MQYRFAHESWTFAIRHLPIKSLLLLASMCPTVWAQENAVAAQPVVISWKTLQPTGNSSADPFSKLSEQQLRDLGFVVRVRELVAAEKLSESSEDFREATDIARQLQKDGVDIEWLIGQRTRIAALRRARSRAVAKDVSRKHKDQEVQIAGYVIPLKKRNGILHEFFVVPSIAACSHASAPPENQLIHVSLEKGIRPAEGYMAVRLTGKLQAAPVTRKVASPEGPKPFTAGYSFQTTQIESRAVSPGVQSAKPVKNTP